LIPSNHALTSDVARSLPIKSARATVSAPAVLNPRSFEIVVKLVAIFCFT
jgi:hypothetical protein